MSAGWYNLNGHSANLRPRAVAKHDHADDVRARSERVTVEMAGETHPVHPAVDVHAHPAENRAAASADHELGRTSLS
jgi:hypothetical protein